jgi:phosphoribosylanthranilate isomerase
MQLHGDIEVSELQKIKKLRPDIEIIKSLVVRGNNFDELEKMVDSLSPYVDAFITDTFDPSTGAEGATGKTHDWNISAMLVELSDKPVILAGGLNADNVKEAILQVCPAGVDIHTGVEGKDGRKDYELVKKFVEEAKAGFAEIESV